MLFMDIDGCLVKCEIQNYVSKISLFGNDPIRDLEYIVKCVEYMKSRASRENSSKKEIDFIENDVLPYVKNNLYERLKECRDCFLEYDNYSHAVDRQTYIKEYQKDEIIASVYREKEIIKYLQSALKLAHHMIQYECYRAKLENARPNLPFSISNDNNDIFDDSIDGIIVSDELYNVPVNRALSAMKRIKDHQTSDSDDFLSATTIVGNEHIVDYDKIYTPVHLEEDAKETLFEVSKAKTFDKIIALSHFTGERESYAKRCFMDYSFPFIEIYDESLLKFHTSPSKKGVRRARSSKALQAKLIMKKYFGIDSIEGCYLIDDSIDNLIAWHEAGGNAILYRPRTRKELALQEDEQIDSRLFRIFNWSKKEINKAVEFFENSKNKSDSKVLYKKY